MKQFKRFPETISPDGAFVLAWGPALESPTGSEQLAQLTEVDYEDEAFDKANGEKNVSNYLVDAVARKVVAIIPGFEYFRGPNMQRNKAGLAVAWSSDAERALAIFEGHWSTNAIVSIEPRARKIVDVHTQLNNGFYKVLRKSEPSFNNVEVTMSTPVLVRPDLLVVSAYGEIPKESSTEQYLLKFKISGAGDKVQFRLESGGKPPEHVAPDGDTEAELNKVYQSLRTKLSPKQRDELRQVQLRWLKRREEIRDKDSRERFTQHRITELQTLRDSAQ